MISNPSNPSVDWSNRTLVDSGKPYKPWHDVTITPMEYHSPIQLQQNKESIQTIERVDLDSFNMQCRSTQETMRADYLRYSQAQLSKSYISNESSIIIKTEPKQRGGIFMFFNLLVKKKELELEVKKLTDMLDIERKKLASEFEILRREKEFEIVKLQKSLELDYNDKLNKQAVVYEKSIRNLEAVANNEKSELKSSLAKDYYDKLSKAMTQLNIEGSQQSKFVQDLSLKMFEKGLEKPMPAHIIHENHLLTSRKDD